MSDKNQLSADLAIELYEALIEARRLYLHPALSEAVKSIGVIKIDDELHRFVPLHALNHLAQLGLRGELVFPVPSVLRQAPSLSGYYRMLLGFSKKEFSKRGYGSWVKAEENNRLSVANELDLERYCSLLIEYLSALIYAMGKFEDRDLNDLALLTLGPTLQGGRNNVIGSTAERQMFQIFLQLVEPHVIHVQWPIIRFKLPDGQTFEMINKSDPDLALRMGSGTESIPLLAVEVKGGGDASNAHNRAGEAEKSHLKAINYRYRWTIIQIPPGQRNRITQETPSSTDVFNFNEILKRDGADWEHFRQKFLDILGLY